jgi:hypothetical protein
VAPNWRGILPNYESMECSLGSLHTLYLLYRGKQNHTKKILNVSKRRMEVERQILVTNHQTHNFTLYKSLNKQNHAV